MSHDPEWIDDLYTKIANEEDARVCKAISDDACQEVPGNFFLILLSNSLTKIGDRLASPKTTLAWLLQALGAPAFFTGLIVPLRESGSLIPQLAIAGYIRQLPLRKWVWVTGSAVQGLSVAGMGFVAMGAQGSTAGWSIVALLVMFSLARGFASIASKDVLGKTIPKTRRGRLKGLMTSISGLIAMAAGGALVYESVSGTEESSAFLYTLFLFIAAVLWIIAATSWSFVREFPGETDGGGNAGAEALKQLKLLKLDRPFRDFVIIRALAFGSGLGAPYIISIAHRALGGEAIWLGIFIVIDGLAALLAGPAMGKIADRSSRFLLRSAMFATFILLASIATVSAFEPARTVSMVLYPLAFFILGIIHSAVRVGRKTYLVDLAEGNKRTSYVALSNSVIGVLLLIAGLITGGISLVSPELALATFALMALTGAVLGSRLPETTK